MGFKGVLDRGRGWFTLAEDDFLRYHDLDIALFFGNLRGNCAERFRAWRRSRL